MTSSNRSLLRVLSLCFFGLIAVSNVFAKTTLQVVRGSGEFQTFETTMTVTAQEALTMQWMTDQPGAKGGIWRVTNASAGNAVVASGEAAAPAVGHFIRFTIAANAFLHASPPLSPLKFNITIVAHDAANQPLGFPSAPVVVNQVPKGPAQPPVNFGGAANFPSVTMVSYNEKIGQVPQTQLRYAGADVTLRVTNTGKAPTDPIWLRVDDSSLLMRQNTPNASVPALSPGASQTVNVHIDAILPPAKSQLPEELQYAEWKQEYIDRCGVDLRAVMTWRGPQAQAPMNDRMETSLVPEGWTDYAKTSPNTAICDGAQCVKPCQIAKNIHKELDGHVVGYAFFAGMYPKFGSFGDARTTANGPERVFTPSTKITVASVSKAVTAIAAMRILDKNNVALNAAIGPYLPSDWSPSSYVKNITFGQLLGHRSGIMDYGNVTQDYAALKKFFTQSVSNTTTTTCQPSKVVNPMNPINPNNTTKPCYSNYNFAIFRVLLPKVAGLAEDSNQSTRPKTLADQYVKLVQQNVFDRVGQKNVECKPPANTTYAFAYNYPGKTGGNDWGDVSLQCGASGWYLSVEDIAKVLLSMTTKDGKILAETATKKQLDIMRTNGLGWDVYNNNELEKNGGWGAANGSITTTVAIFGPVTGPRMVGVLFINSDISGGPSDGKNAKSVLEKSYTAALFPKP
jgi:CubicO group peptidase (beta-lactamase class C family)